MKQVFFLIFASAALSFAGCKSGPKSSDMADSTATHDMVNEAMDSVTDMTNTMHDTAQVIMDTTKK